MVRQDEMKVSLVLQSKDSKTFSEWIATFQIHRLYRQFEIAYGTHEAPKMTGVKTPVEDFATPLTSPLQGTKEHSSSDLGQVYCLLLDNIISPVPIDGKKEEENWEIGADKG